MKKRRNLESRKPRRRLKILAVLLALALVLLIGELLASRMIADKLRATVSSKLDAQLELGPLVYVPPYGAWTWNARITRDGEELFTVSRVKLSLAEFPFKDKPIIISKLNAHQPVLNLGRGRFDNIKKPDAKDVAPRKLSGMLRLKHVRLTDGQVTYADAQRPGAPPTVWGNLGVDVDTIQTSVSKYTFHVLSRAAPLAEVTAAGTIDVDDLLLSVQSSTIKLRAEPEPVRSPLPAAVQEFIRQRRINGSIQISGNGKIPLRDPKQSNFSASVALQNATAAVSPTTVINDARASLVAKMAPGGPIVARIDRLEVASGGKQAIVNEGLIELNAAKGFWSIGDIDGQLIFTLPTTAAANAARVASRPAAPRSPPPPPRPATTGPQTRPGVDEPRGMDKLAIAGKGDFTAAVSGPFNLNGKNPWEAIRHEVIVYPRDASFRPKDFAGRIEGVGGGEIRLQDGMIIFQELEGHYGDDLLRLRSARLPVEGLPKLGRWQEISGTIVFHRPVGRYSPKLDKIFDPLNPNGSFLIAGSWIVDKRDESLTPEGKPRHAFDLIVSTDTGSFSLTERNILLEKMRGDATVSNGGVDIHELQAQVLDGTLQTTGRWVRESPQRSTYEGDVILRNVDLALLEDRFREEPVDKPLVGRIYAGGSLRGAIAKGAAKAENLGTMEVAGEIEIIRGSLFKMPVVKQVTEQIKGLKGAANVGDAAAEFDIEKGRIKFRNAAVSSPVVGLQGGGTMTLDGSELDLRVVAAPLADWRENLKSTKIPVVSKVAGEVAGAIQQMLNAATGTLLYEFRVQGEVDRPEVIAVPTPVLTDTAAFVFGKMLTPPKKDQRPIDLLRRDREPSPRAETR